MPGKDDCLIRHLLYASVQTYHDDPAYGGTPRWIDGPAEIPPAGGRANRDFALVGRFREGIVVAFRGTLPPADVSPGGHDIIATDARIEAIAADWLNGANLRLVHLENERIAIPGRVHKGFATSLSALWPDVVAAVDRLRSGSAAPRLYFTGHSKGGALANLAALAAHKAWPRAAIKAVTFGAPRTGDGDFATGYAEAGIDCRRYEVTADPVPGLLGWASPVGSFLPRRLVAVGNPVLRQPTARPSYSPFDFRQRAISLFAAHLPYRGFGYGDHVCTDELCTHDWE